MVNSRRKGKVGELEWSKILRDHGYKDARRGQQYKGGGDSPDVTGLPGIHQEVKRVEKLNIHDAMDQSKRDAADAEVPIVVHRRDRTPWLVTMSAEDWLKLYYSAQHVTVTDDDFDDKEAVRMNNPFDWSFYGFAEDDER